MLRDVATHHHRCLTAAMQLFPLLCITRHAYGMPAVPEMTKTELCNALAALIGFVAGVYRDVMCVPIYVLSPSPSSLPLYAVNGL